MSLANSMKDKVLIITGAANGMGLASCKLALESGAKVLGVDISPFDAALAGSPSFKSYQADLTDEHVPDAVTKAAISEFGGRIDGLLNIAGILDGHESAVSIDKQKWDKVIAVNLTAPVMLMKQVIPIMQKQGGGAIVNVASRAGLTGAAAGIAYTCSKNGLIGATQQTAFRFREDRIRCNAVAPGATLTNMADPNYHKSFDFESYKVSEPFINMHIGARNFAITEPAEVAALMLFLISDQARSINGSVVPIDQAWCTM